MILLLKIQMVILYLNSRIIHDSKLSPLLFNDDDCQGRKETIFFSGRHIRQFQGILWQSSGLGLGAFTLMAWVQSMVEELSSCKLCGTAKIFF